MTVDLSGEEIGLIQESLIVKIANLEQFERHCENQQEVQERCADVRKLRNIAVASLYSHQDCCGKD